MNERIQELVEQCYEKHELLGTYEFNKEKFAKLIVQECVNVLHKNDLYTKQVSEVFCKHFGVEE